LLLALVFPWCLPNPAVTSIAVFTLLYAASAVGWNIFSGFTGYISLGHAAYFGLGAYTMAIACQDWQISAGLAPFLLLPLSGLVACLGAVVLGWIALRVRGNTFVVITIAIIFTFQLLAYNLAGITNGSTGMDLPVPSWSGAVFNLPFYYVSLALCLLALGVCWWVRNSKFGLGLLAIRDDEERAVSLGVRTGTYKLTAYVLSAFFAGVAGGIYAYFVGSIYPPFAFDPNYDVAITLMSFFGGLGTVWGPLLGTVLVGPLQQYMTLQFGENGFSQILYGCIFLGTLLLLPEGIVPSLQHLYPHGRNTLTFLLHKRKNICLKKNQG
jgi:branched-chain amino acid transport system permease protein